MAALWYATRGVPIFPISPLSKKPLFPRAHDDKDSACRGECGVAGHGLYDATTEVELVTSWWTSFPDANIGIACGFPGPDVLDIDVKDGVPGVASANRIAHEGMTAGYFWRVKTPSGGLHLYYEGTGQMSGSARKSGIDFRGKGGYVLAPPSVLDNGTYSVEIRRSMTGKTVNWTKIRDFLEPPRKVERGTDGFRTDGFDGLLHYMETCQEGGRNNSLYSITRAFVDEGASEADFADLAAAAERAGLTAHEIDNTMRSARRA